MKILNKDGTFGDEIDTRDVSHSVNLLGLEQAKQLEARAEARRVKAEQESQRETERQAKIAAEWKRNR